MRFFNTSGPVVPADHYCVPPLERVDLDDICQLVHNKRYFVLHAPRQTGKTSVLLALRDLLNSGEIGDYRCVAEAGHLVVFDRDDGRSWEEKVFCRRELAGGVEVLVWGM